MSGSIIQSSSTAEPREDLGVALYEFLRGENDYIAQLVLPWFGVGEKQGDLTTLLRAELTRRVNTQRAPGGSYSRGTFKTGGLSYNCKEYGHEQPLDDAIAANYRNRFNAEKASIMIAFERVLLDLEIRAKTAIFNATTWTGAALFTDNSAAPWSTPASDMIGHVGAATLKVRAVTGMDPNALIVGHETWTNMKKNTEVLNRIRYVQVANDQNIAAAIADILNVERIIIGKGVYNSADEGQDASMTDIWSKTYASLARLPKTQNLEEACMGRTLHWEAQGEGIIVSEQYREEARRSEIYRARTDVDQKIFDEYFAHLMQIEA